MPFEIDPRRIPIIGSSIYNVGQVYRTVAQPCSPDPYIMVQATFTYAPTMIWALIKPEPLDLAFDRAGRRHRRITRRRFHIFDLQQIEAPQRGTTGWYFFRLAQLGERVGYFLLIADATTTFAVNWTTLVWEYSGCQTPSIGYARAYGAFGTIGSAITTIDAGIVFPNYEATGSGFAGPGIVKLSSPGPKSFGMSIDLSITDNGSGTPSIDRVYVIRTIAGGTDYVTDLTPTVLPDGRTAWTTPDNLWGGLTPDTEWRIRCTFSHGRLQMNGGMMQCVAAPEQGLQPDP